MPESAAVKDIDDISILTIFWSHIDIGKDYIDPSLMYCIVTILLITMLRC